MVKMISTEELIRMIVSGEEFSLVDVLGMGYGHALDYKGGLKDCKETNLPLEGALHEEVSGTGHNYSRC
jgi:hypothetical protein